MNRERPGSYTVFPRAFDAAILTVLTAFLLWHLSPADLLRNTTTVGGDTPAHNYLASHLKQQLFGHGRIVSWAGGWWGGFPMFQYYFCLPYLGIALLSVLIPFNVALKLVSVAGAVLLPLSAYASARVMRLPRPVPVLMAVFMVPFLFVSTHTMWGVNLASTLAGMISNSLSFALMLPAIACAWRDAEDQRVRIRTVVLIVLVMASHFFTSVMTALTLAAAPLCCLLAMRAEETARQRPVARFGSALRVLAVEGLLAALLMAWWLVPLVAKSAYSMDFGENWPLAFWRTFPDYTAGVLPFAAAGLALGLKRGHRAAGLFAWMLAAGLVLFFFGYGLSPVFVNVRLWPFVFFAVIALGAIGFGLLLERVPANGAVVVLLAAAVLVGVTHADRIGGKPGPGLVRAWAQWNYSGLETKPAARVIDELVRPLQGTPGRLANDLCEENNLALGSSRVFELAPHLTGKPILEGGLVNSAIGSLFAYYIQSETSKSCAGYPPIVVPTTFNFTNATRHLELFNVKHFIACWAVTQQALQQDPRWRLLRRAGEWDLYELTTHDGRQVSIPDVWPVVVETERWKECALEWFYTIGAIDQPVIFCRPGQAARLPASCPRLSEARFTAYLAALRGASTNPPALLGAKVNVQSLGPIREEPSSENRIVFHTDAVGAPHIVRCSYFPNWKVRGAREVFMVSPAFMLVFPDRERVELYYGSIWSDRLGYGLTALGCGLLVWTWRRRKTAALGACG